MRTLTIIEGADCTGKSTLISEAFKDCHVEHFGPPPRGGKLSEPPAWRQYVTAMAEDLAGRSVYDRFFYGELVYGPLLRNDRRFDHIMLRMLERVALGRRAVAVLCEAPLDAILDVWLRRKDQELIKAQETMAKTIEAFRDVVLNAQLSVIRYDWTQDDPKEVRERVEVARDPVNKGPGIGCFKPGKVDLLVGDRINPNASEHEWPFVATTGSSYWLTRKLEQEKISEGQLYWVNSAGPQGLTDPKFIDELMPRRIFAMGHAANAWCRKTAGLSGAIHVPHPQFWKRFHSNERYPLLDHLKQPPAVRRVT